MGLRVLIVDDALFMRGMLKDFFIKGGHEVVGEAADGREAVAQYRRLRPDLVTMDIVMPQVGGLEALAEIRREDPEACVVMCSAMGQEALILEAVRAGARDFIVKPFSEEKVLETARRVTRRA
ncbi:response regulator [Trichloromonas sp.]|uniref:response regulator n=1 Tax=Trichloromonas sp. TaxID=3069249 RepID=UPI002A41C0FC|nr:response regulator [Trichloromonas sp.]